MTRSLIVVAVIALCGVAGLNAATDTEWFVFKSRHGKDYGNHKEDAVRRLIWEDNLRRIERHNELYAKNLSSFYLGENEYADMTNTEFSKMMNGFCGLRQNDSRPIKYEVPKYNMSLPSEVNWVLKGYVTPVKNQGQCGSCWSFSSTGALEGANFKRTGRLVSLSEKNLMDCTWSYGNQGCGGGWMDHAFQYVITNRGIDTEQGYPYYPQSDHYCHYNSGYYGGTAVSFTDIPSGSEAGLQQASATVGPISVAIDATHYSFQLYRGGIYDEPQCSPSNLDHAVLVVGYGTYYGKDYWLVKNSWGAYWGEAGYIRMSRNKYNQCGIATKASYPLV